MSTQNLTFGTEVWTVTAPDDVTITQPSSGLLKIAIDYSKASLLNGQAHGIDTITFTPVTNGQASFNGFKSAVEFDVTNGLPVATSGFDIMLFNNTPATGALDTMDPTGHPDNYAHLHNTTGANGTGLPFAPLAVTTFLPNFMQDPDGLAPVTSKDDTPPSELRAAGLFTPGQTVSSKTATMHSEELAGADNGFGINFFVLADPPTTPPSILNVPATVDGSTGVSHPFSTTVVTDTNPLPLETTTITVKDAAGALTDSATLTDTGLTHTGTGTYTLPVSLPADLTAALQALTVNSSGDLTVTISVDNDGPSDAPAPAIASTTIKGPAPVVPLAISVSGTPQEGQVLTATVNNTKATIDWQRSPDGTTWTNIPNAHGTTYTLAEADENDQVRAVAFTSPSTSKASDPTAKVTDVPPTLTLSSIAGTPQEGQTLSISSTVTTDEPTSPSDVKLQWQSSSDGKNWDNIGGANSPTYVPVAANDDKFIRVTGSFTDDTNQTATTISAPTTKVTAPPQPLAISISGTPQEGQTLTATVNNSKAAIDWQRSPDGTNWTNITDAHGTTYVVAEADENDQVRAVAFTSPSTSKASDPTAKVTDVPPTLSVTVVYPVLIDIDSNNPTEGLTLTAVPTLKTDDDNSAKDVTYQWQRSTDGSNWNDIGGATANTYVAAEADENDNLRVIASFTDDTNQNVKAVSDPTPKVVDVRPSLAISISGDTQEGSTLTAAPKLTTNADNSVKDVTYQWQRSPDGGKTWSTIDGATNITYQTVAADDNNLIRNEASFTDDTGQNAGADSNSIGPIQKPQPPDNHFQVIDTSNGQSSAAPGDHYNGPVQGIDWQWIVPQNMISDNLNMTALNKNVFIHTGDGNDAIDVSKTNGTNILDGSTGSNFMTGGTGDDTFFVDDRGPNSPIWTTVRGAHSGDDVTIFGLTQNDFQQMSFGNDVLPIAPGLDFALSEKGKPDVNVTLTGFSTADLKNGKLNISFGHTQDTPGLPGSDYMMVHIN
jgi:hypothetical protein